MPAGSVRRLLRGCVAAGLFLGLAGAEAALRALARLDPRGEDLRAHVPLPEYADADVARRVFREMSLLQYEADPYRVVRIAPNQSFSTIRIDRRGFRGEDFPETKPPGEVRVFVLGGSIAWGTGATGDTGTISAFLAEELRAMGFDGVRVVNAAVGGYVVDQELETLMRVVLPLAPDVVVAVDGLNDVYAAVQHGRVGLPIGFETTRTHRWAPTPFRRLLERSRVYWVVRSRLERRRGGTGPAALERGSLPPPEALASHLVETYRRMRRLAAADVRFVFVLQPTPFTETRSLTAEERWTSRLHAGGAAIPAIFADLYYPRLRREVYASDAPWLAALGAGDTVIDAVDAFADLEGPVYFDHCHFSDRGNRRLAAFIAPRVAAVLRDRR